MTISPVSPDLIISVDQIRPSPKGGKTLAYADVRIGPVFIFGISVVENNDGKGHFVGDEESHSSDFPIIIFYPMSVAAIDQLLPLPASQKGDVTSVISVTDGNLIRAN